MGVDLRTFFVASQRTPFAWGVNDGLTWICDWAIQNGHPDPMGAGRGSYDDAASARRVVRGHGGMLAMVRRGLAGAGLTEIDPADAKSGDIGLGRVADTDPRTPACGLIRAGAYWAGLHPALRVVVADAEVLAAWRV